MVCFASQSNNVEVSGKSGGIPCFHASRQCHSCASLFCLRVCVCVCVRVCVLTTVNSGCALYTQDLFWQDPALTSRDSSHVHCIHLYVSVLHKKQRMCTHSVYNPIRTQKKCTHHPCLCHQSPILCPMSLAPIFLQDFPPDFLVTACLFFLTHTGICFGHAAGHARIWCIPPLQAQELRRKTSGSRADWRRAWLSEWWNWKAKTKS
jgi:hypothetical protein